MEQLFKKKKHLMARCVLDKREECPLSSEYTLPEYYPDIAMVLKCLADPHIQSRQWSGEQMLLDGTAVIRVLYLDEGRRRLHCMEFTIPFSCAMRGAGQVDNAAVQLELQTKYLTCRAVGPRCVEVRGAIGITARGDGVVEEEFLEAENGDDLYCRTEEMSVTIPTEAVDKIVTVSESLEFPTSLPPAEMLLGGECQAVIQECKLFRGKAIAKGHIYLHQLYTDAVDSEKTYTLDFTIPFSQIFDMEHASEDMPLQASVHVLSDTERCTIGPDGENTMLDVTVKLLLQLRLYTEKEIKLLKDAYHRRYPVMLQRQDMDICTLIGSRREENMVSMSVQLSDSQWKELVELWVQPMEYTPQSECGVTKVQGRMNIGVVARDAEGEICYSEFVEGFCLEFPCSGNFSEVKLNVTGTKYRVIEGKLELQVSVSVTVSDYNCNTTSVVSDAHLQQDAPYPIPTATALLYYADAGESVWDIGKACHASPEAIRDENDMASDGLTEAAVLIVPLCG